MSEQENIKEEEKDSPNVQIMPPTVFNVCLIYGIMGELVVPLPFPSLPLEAALVLAAFLAGSGFAFMMWGHGRFQSLGTAVKTNLPAAQLVTDGAYRFSRNPMYVGFLAILFGIGVGARRLWILSSVFPMILYLAYYVIPREEAYLTRRFDQSFERYKTKVRRWL